MPDKKSNEKEWEFKETREKLIKMVESWMDKKWSKSIAMDIVDAIFIETCEYKDKKFNEERDSLIDKAREIMKLKLPHNILDFGYIEKISKEKKSGEK